MRETIITRDSKVCADAIKDGGIVAFATETVYGLGADCFNEKAVREVFAAKGRPADNPLIVHVSSIEQAKTVVKEWTEEAEALAQAFWPGPLSLVMEKADGVLKIVTGGKDTVAVRMPGKYITQQFLKECGCPVAAPSANRSTRPSPTKAEHVLCDMDGKIPYILDGGSCEKGIESTVLDLSTKTLLRPGTVTVEELEEIVGPVAVFGQQGSPKSPGIKYPHYRPNYKVVLIKGNNVEKMTKELYNLASAKGEKCVILDAGNVMLKKDENIISFGSSDELCAAQLYDTLIGYEGKIDTMLVAGTSMQGIGLALMNRLEKAAAENIVIS